MLAGRSGGFRRRIRRPAFAAAKTGAPWWVVLARTLDPRRDRVTGYAAVGIVGVLAAVSLVFGTGASSALPHLANIGAWLGSSKKGQIVHANGLSGKVDGRIAMTNAAGHPLKIVQDGNVILVVDEVTGQVSRIDPAQLQVTETRQYGASSLQVVVGPSEAYVVNSAKGSVQQINPVSLDTIGAPVSVQPAPLGRAAIGADATLWVLDPAAGQAVPVKGARRGTPVKAGDPHDQLALTIANGKPLVVDANTASAMLAGPSGALFKVNLPSTISAGAAGGQPQVLVPATEDGPVVPVLAPSSGSLVLVNTATRSVSTTSVSPAGHHFGAPQILGERVYIPDQSTGNLIVYDTASSQFDSQIPVTGNAASLESFQQDGILWVNDQNGPVALAVDSSGGVHRIGKYSTAAPGGPHIAAPLPAPGGPQNLSLPGPGGQAGPAAPGGSGAAGTPPGTAGPPAVPGAQPPRASQPPAAPPGAPGTPSTTSGNGYIDVSFTPSGGGTPSGYQLEPSPGGVSVQPSQAPASGPFTFHVTGGNCGTQYTFRVAAVYPRGRVTSASSAPARPCVSPVVQGFQATGINHGANLSWSAPAGGPAAYTISYAGATSGTVPAAGTSAQITSLTNGGQYNFTLTAANAAGSAQATTSASLVPPPQGYNAFDDQSAGPAIRSGPGTGYAQVGSIPQNSSQPLTVQCQVSGGTATDPYQSWKISSIWDEIGPSQWVSDLYVNTPHSAGTGSSAPDPFPPGDFSYPPIWQCS